MLIIKSPNAKLSLVEQLYIQFTFEEEDKGTLHFLDVLIQRKGNSVVTTIFGKPTNSDIYLNWNTCIRYLEKRDFKNTTETCIHSIFY